MLSRRFIIRETQRKFFSVLPIMWFFHFPHPEDYFLALNLILKSLGLIVRPHQDLTETHLKPQLKKYYFPFRFFGKMFNFSTWRKFTVIFPGGLQGFAN